LFSNGFHRKLISNVPANNFYVTTIYKDCSEMRCILNTAKHKFEIDEYGFEFKEKTLKFSGANYDIPQSVNNCIGQTYHFTASDYKNLLENTLQLCEKRQSEKSIINEVLHKKSPYRKDTSFGSPFRT
jgi:hypothetical protein